MEDTRSKWSELFEEINNVCVTYLGYKPEQGWKSFWAPVKKGLIGVEPAPWEKVTRLMRISKFIMEGTPDISKRIKAELDKLNENQLGDFVEAIMNLDDILNEARKESKTRKEALVGARRDAVTILTDHVLHAIDNSHGIFDNLASNFGRIKERVIPTKEEEETL